jgi:ATP-dependent DNA helicase RecG
MNPADLTTKNEGKTLEFKRDLSSTENILKTLTAFANSAGGTLLIGVEDGGRRVRGVTDVLKEEERLASLLTDGISPRLMPEIEILAYRKLQLLAVVVHPSSLRPHFVAKMGPEAGTYVRVGSTNRRADPELAHELRREARLEAFDEQAVPGRNSEAIDFRVASEFFKPVRKLKTADLQTLKITVANQGRQMASVGGLLLFGKDRFKDFPDAYVQAGAFAGKDKTKITDTHEFREPLPGLVEPVLAFVSRQLRQGLEIKGAQSAEVFELPPVALREALVNALVHADYSQKGAPIRVAVFDDRIEFENPGLLPFGMTPEDAFRGVSKVRNRVLARVFKELRYIEQWGSGLQRAMDACVGLGLRAPVLEELGSKVRLTLHRTRQSTVTVPDSTEQKILAALKAHGSLRPSKIAAILKLTPRAVRNRMNDLAGKGLVRARGTSSRDPMRDYVLAKAETAEPGPKGRH